MIYLMIGLCCLAAVVFLESRKARRLRTEAAEHIDGQLGKVDEWITIFREEAQEHRISSRDIRSEMWQMYTAVINTRKEFLALAERFREVEQSAFMAKHAESSLRATEKSIGKRIEKMHQQILAWGDVIRDNTTAVRKTGGFSNRIDNLSKRIYKLEDEQQQQETLDAEQNEQAENSA